MHETKKKLSTVSSDSIEEGGSEKEKEKKEVNPVKNNKQRPSLL